MPTMHTIRSRHSVRQYENRPVEGETLRAIEEMVESAQKSSGLDIQLIQNNPEAFNVFASFGLIKGARTLIAFVADGRTQDRSIGYWGQRLVLELQDLGLNTCWAAIFSKRKCRAKVAEGKSIRVVIALGYGTTNGHDRPTKEANQVSRVEADHAPEWFFQVVEAAQLAPTGMNRQDFTVVLKPDGRSIEVECSGTGLSSIDAGIVMANIEVAANEEAADWSFSRPCA